MTEHEWKQLHAHEAARRASMSRHPAAARRARPSVRIDCEHCVMRTSTACEDCVVSFIANREPGDAIVIDVAEERALRSLARAGLTAPLRHRAARP